MFNIFKNKSEVNIIRCYSLHFQKCIYQAHIIFYPFRQIVVLTVYCLFQIYCMYTSIILYMLLYIYICYYMILQK